MRDGQSSRTAEYNALFRALETCRPARLRLFEDRAARHFLTTSLAVVVKLAAIPGVGRLVERYIDHRWPGVRTSVVARTRLIDDTINATLMAASDDERWQFVALGAGFDTRPHRLVSLRSASIFEVDHPATQTTKRARLAAADGAVRPDIRYVATDFAEGHLADRLDDAGYDHTTPTIIVWEGVSNYLTPDAVDTTLRWCATTAPGSLLVFTYVHSDVITDPTRYVGTTNLAKSLARSGEPLTFGIDPQEIDDYLAQRGLSLQADIGASDYRQRCYGTLARNMHGHEFYRVAVARVGTELTVRSGHHCE
jgi:methyltransferase (TIGR00027 family)